MLRLKLSITLLLAIAVKCHMTWAGKNDFAESLRHKQITDAVKKIVAHDFVHKRQLRHVSCYIQSFDYYHRKFFLHLLDSWPNKARATLQIGQGIPIPHSHQRHNAVLFVDSPKSLLFLYETIIEDHLDIRGHYIIVFHNFKNHYYDDLVDISIVNFAVGVLNANILVYVNDNLILLFSTFPYTRFHCEGVAPVIWNKYTNNQWQHYDFFPDKIANMHGCRIVCSTWEEMPFLRVVRSKTGQLNYLGIEGRLLEYLERRMNFKTQFNWMSIEEIVRTQNEDDLIFHEIFTNGTDIAVGAFPYRPPCLYFQSTIPYYLSKLKLLLSSKSTTFGGFTKLLFPFEGPVWEYLFSVMGIAILIIFLLGFRRTVKQFVIGNRNRTPIYNMFIMLLGGSVSIPPTRNFARFLLYMWIMFSFVLRCSYQALLYHFIRTDKSIPPPSTVTEAINAGLKFHMTESVSNSLSFWLPPKVTVVPLNGSEMENFEYVKSGMAIVTPIEYFEYFINSRRDALKDYYAIPENIFIQPYAIYLARSSFFTAKLNYFISTFTCEGLMTKFSNEYFYKTGKKLIKESKPTKMSLIHISGAMWVLLIGNIIGIFIFLIENLIFKLRQPSVDGI